MQAMQQLDLLQKNMLVLPASMRIPAHRMQIRGYKADNFRAHHECLHAHGHTAAA